MTNEDRPVHPRVAAIVDEVVEAGGPAAEVRYLRAGAWRLRWATDRVEAFTTVFVRATGRTVLDDGELRIDGKRCRPARDPVHLAEVLRDPDAYLAEVNRPQEPMEPRKRDGQGHGPRLIAGVG